MAKKKSPVGKFFSDVANGIYFLISCVNLQYAILVLLVGLVLFLTGVFSSAPVVKTIFFIVLAITIFLAIFLTIKKLFVKKSDKKKKKDVGDVSDFGTENTAKQNQVESENQSVVTLPITEQMEIAKENGVTEKSVVYPIYSKVRQNNNYVMAEFEDRYELYYNSEKGLVRVRTDYKK